MGLGATGLRLYDQSGYGKHGTLTNMEANDWTPSEGKMALAFGGTDERVFHPSVFTGITNFTHSFWVKNPNEFSNFYPCADSAYVYYPRINGSVITTSFAGLTYTRATTSDKLFHIAITRNGSNAELFVDGTSRSTATGVSTTPLGSGFGFGAIYDFGFDSGTIDDSMFYNKALTPSEIKTLALRRGIAYEMKRPHRGYVATAATSNRNNMLMGCGL